MKCGRCNGRHDRTGSEVVSADGIILKKGSTIHLIGKNRTRSYEDKQGVKRYVTEMVGDELIMLDKKED